MNFNDDELPMNDDDVTQMMMMMTVMTRTMMIMATMTMMTATTTMMTIMYRCYIYFIKNTRPSDVTQYVQGDGSETVSSCSSSFRPVMAIAPVTKLTVRAYI